jgi:ABC-type hemin transport system ATPase subunit
VVELQDVGYSVAGIQLLVSVFVRFRPGLFIDVLGPNGAG